MSDFRIQPSQRLLRLPPYLFARINALKHKKRQEGIDMIDLGMGNPTDPTPQPIVDKLCEAARDPRNQRYSASKGVFNLRRDVARHYHERYGVKVDPETEVVACIGACGLAPVVTVNGDFHAGVTPDSVRKILKQYSKGDANHGK